MFSPEILAREHAIRNLSVPKFLFPCADRQVFNSHVKENKKYIHPISINTRVQTIPLTKIARFI